MAIKIKAKIKEKPVKEIFIDTDFIRLDSALKLADAVRTGFGNVQCSVPPA